MHKKLQIIYRNNKPYGIRDETGFLFFFAKVSRFSGQEERYREEVMEQYRLADYLLSSLQGRTAEKAEAETLSPTSANASDASPQGEIAPMCGNCMSENCVYTISVGSKECKKRFKPVRLPLAE